MVTTPLTNTILKDPNIFWGFIGFSIGYAVLLYLRANYESNVSPLDDPNNIDILLLSGIFSALLIYPSSVLVSYYNQFESLDAVASLPQIVQCMIVLGAVLISLMSTDYWKYLSFKHARAKDIKFKIKSASLAALLLISPLIYLLLRVKTNTLSSDILNLFSNGGVMIDIITLLFLYWNIVPVWIVSLFSLYSLINISIYLYDLST